MTFDQSLTSSKRACISFPFVDRLNDGYSAMVYNDEILITASATGVAAAFEALGYDVTPARFEPECNAYAYVQPSRPHSALYSKAFGNSSSAPGIAWQLAPVSWLPFSIDL